MRSIENLLRRHIGLDTTAIGATLIERTVRRRMKQCGLSQPGTYHQRLTTDPHELEQLVEAIVVTETWFFRDHETFHTLARLACHDQPPPPPTAPLRLLSLPCASGEEPYSIAMALLDAGAADTTFQIDAIDISIHALARAQQAEYGKNSFRGNQLDYRARHFIPNQDRYTLSPRVRRPVKFERGNILAADFLAGSPPYDFIFCRNLLIYFDPAAQHLALSKLHQHLAPDGVLFVGPAELPLTTAHGFVHAGLPMAFACRKSEDRRPTAEVRGPKTDLRPPISALRPQRPPNSKTPGNTPPPAATPKPPPSAPPTSTTTAPALKPTTC